MQQVTGGEVHSSFCCGLLLSKFLLSMLLQAPLDALLGILVLFPCLPRLSTPTQIMHALAGLLCQCFQPTPTWCLQRPSQHYANILSFYQHLDRHPQAFLSNTLKVFSLLPLSTSLVSSNLFWHFFSSPLQSHNFYSPSQTLVVHFSSSILTMQFIPALRISRHARSPFSLSLVFFVYLASALSLSLLYFLGKDVSNLQTQWLVLSGSSSQRHFFLLGQRDCHLSIKLTNIHSFCVSDTFLDFCNNNDNNCELK